MLKVNWRPDGRELRKFGVTLIVGFGVIGGIARAAGHPTVAAWMWGVSTAAGVLALAVPRAALPVYWAWMGIGFVMGSIVSRLAMAVIFFGIITPLAFVFKVKGRDALGLKKKREGGYWTEHPRIDDPKAYDHLF
jgi:hypothetical protein